MFDLAIIGGGINGCGCAADASLRGLSVVLLEQDDLASKTSSSSTKLIHGGLRYLEQYEFSLVRKALKERQILLNLAPHLVYPQAFILPYQNTMRPAWLLRLGLFFYDHLTRKNQLPKCKSIKKNQNPHYFQPLVEELQHGFSYYDAATDDARLTIANALQAKNHGASIRTDSKVVQAKIINQLWQLRVQPKKGPLYTLTARCLINAAGPWVESIAALTQTPIQHQITRMKGSHILVPKLYEGNHAYLLQHQDQRIIFVIPYHGFSMIGTTDSLFEGPLQEPVASKEEIDYLLQLVNSYFNLSMHREDILFSWSGLRPLVSKKGKKLAALSRDYQYEFRKNPAPIATIFGGKITTYRQLAAEIVNQLTAIFPKMPACATQSTPLPGATFETMNFEQYLLYAKNKYQWIPMELLTRYLYSYGSNTELFLSNCTNMEALGKKYGSSLYQVEVDYLISNEWALYPEDILYRRTKLGLCMNQEDQNALAVYLKEKASFSPTSLS